MKIVDSYVVEEIEDGEVKWERGYTQMPNLPNELWEHYGGKPIAVAMLCDQSWKYGIDPVDITNRFFSMWKLCDYDILRGPIDAQRNYNFSEDDIK